MSIPVRHAGTREMTTGWVHGPSGNTICQIPFITWPHGLLILIGGIGWSFVSLVSMFVPTILEKSMQPHFSIILLSK